MSSVLTLSEYRPSARYDKKPWAEARIEGATASTGPWAAVETFDLDPLDTDPTQPQERGFTTDNADAAQKWFRVVFIDEAGGEEFTEAVSIDVTALATAGDVEKRMGRKLTEDERDAAAFLVDAATATIEAAIEMEIPDPAPRVLKFVCVELACRALANPKALTSESKTLGAYSYAFQHRVTGVEASSPLVLTNSEELMVRRATQKTQGSQPVESHVDEIYEAITGQGGS